MSLEEPLRQTTAAFRGYIMLFGGSASLEKTVLVCLLNLSSLSEQPLLSLLGEDDPWTTEVTDL